MDRLAAVDGDVELQRATHLDVEQVPIAKESHAHPVLARGHQIDLELIATALIMSKIGRYIATTMPPTTTPSATIMTGSISDK